VSVLAAQTEKLSYSIELWDLDAQALERVLARGFSPQLARAIFRAAQKDHPDQRILLRRGTRTVANSAE
jgi:SOS response regulatory protein OraA/RecX